MPDKVLLQSLDARGIATLTLHRPAVHNAFDDDMIERLRGVLARLAADPAVRVLILAAEGKNFSAGADLNWMKRMAGFTQAENLADATRMAEMFHALHAFPKPTVARVQGGAYGGGVGLVAACDIAVSTLDAKFAITEVRLGLTAATIMPYVIAAIGRRAATRYALTAERFDGAEAARIGLVHLAVSADELDGAVEKIVAALLEAGPNAASECLRLIDRVAPVVDEDLRRETAAWIARLRSGEEAQARIAAFLKGR